MTDFAIRRTGTICQFGYCRSSHLSNIRRVTGSFADLQARDLQVEHW